MAVSTTPLVKSRSKTGGAVSRAQETADRPLGRHDRHLPAAVQEEFAVEVLARGGSLGDQSLSAQLLVFFEEHYRMSPQSRDPGAFEPRRPDDDDHFERPLRTRKLAPLQLAPYDGVLHTGNTDPVDAARVVADAAPETFLGTITRVSSPAATCFGR